MKATDSPSVNSRLMVLAAMVAMASILLSPAAPARAQDDVATVGIETLGSVDWNSGRPVQSKVRVEAERAVSGTLSVVDKPEGQAETTYRFDLDLAAGTTAEFPVTLTTGWNGVAATATIQAGGDTLAADSIEKFADGSATSGTVAIFGIDDPPQRVEEIGETQLPVLPLDDSLRGLEQSSSLITTDTALRALDADSTERLRLDGWIRGGGQLIIDGPVTPLDDSYSAVPTANPNRFASGAGSILYRDTWGDDGIPVGGYLGTVGLRNLTESQGLGHGASGELGLLANVGLPAIGLIVGVLFVYTFVAGPVLFGILTGLRSQRKIWILIPALSALVAGGILVVGLFGRDDRTEAHITIVEVHDRGSRATSNLLLTSNFGGNRRLDTPDSWSYLGQGQSEGRPAQVRIGSSSTEIALDMPPGSNALARLSGLAPQFDGVLSIDDVTVDGDEITATVTNSGQARLTDAVAFLGDARSDVGSIDAGQTVTFSVAGSDDSGRIMKELLIWPQVEQVWVGDGRNGPVAVPDDRSSRVAAGAWTEWRLDQGTGATPENMLGIVGWTDDLPSPVGEIDTGRTALFVRTNIDDVRGAIGFRTTTRLPGHEEPIFQDDFAGSPEDSRVTFGPEADLDQLAIQASPNSAGISVWTDEGWMHLDLPDEGKATIEIPEDAVLDGELHLRSWVPDTVHGVGKTVAVVANPDDALPAELRDEQAFRSSADGREQQLDAMVEGSGVLDENQRTELFPTAEEPAEAEGRTVAGTYDAYIVTLAEGQTLTVSMQSSDDSYLELFDDNADLVASNDDIDEQRNSQIAFTADSDGEFEIRAMDLAQGSIDYNLSVEVGE